jgi:hypothetical protein
MEAIEFECDECGADINIATDDEEGDEGVRECDECGDDLCAECAASHSCFLEEEEDEEDEEAEEE